MICYDIVFYLCPILLHFVALCCLLSLLHPLNSEHYLNIAVLTFLARPVAVHGSCFLLIMLILLLLRSLCIHKKYCSKK